MRLDSFSARKRFLTIGQAKVAYYEEGGGDPLVLLHGCPFSSYIWRKVTPLLAPSYRCLAPDLLGLGDTETSGNADWSLRAQAAMIVGLLEALGLERVHVVGHDHGGAVAQLLAAEHPERIDRLVIMNAEAYDNWPSPAERPLLRLTQIPVLGSLAFRLWSLRPLLRLTLAEGKAVRNPEVLTAELLDGYIRANLSDRHRRRKLKRFLTGQLDPQNNRVTTELLDGLKRFKRPTLLIWATEDPHFGPKWGERLRADIPGAVRLELVPDAGHLLMEERPNRVAELIGGFLAEPLAEPRSRHSFAVPGAAGG